MRFLTHEGQKLTNALLVEARSYACICYQLGFIGSPG